LPCSRGDAIGSRRSPRGSVPGRDRARPRERHHGREAGERGGCAHRGGAGAARHRGQQRGADAPRARRRRARGGVGSHAGDQRAGRAARDAGGDPPPGPRRRGGAPACRRRRERQLDRGPDREAGVRRVQPHQVRRERLLRVAAARAPPAARARQRRRARDRRHRAELAHHGPRFGHTPRLAAPPDPGFLHLPAPRNDSQPIAANRHKSDGRPQASPRPIRPTRP
jgi:hypothetical protein